MESIIFIKINNDISVKYDDIKSIEKHDGGYTKSTETWSIAFDLLNKKVYKDFKNKEERDNCFEKLNNFFHAISIDELLKDVRV
jgi:hypothetical protein